MRPARWRRQVRWLSSSGFRFFLITSLLACGDPGAPGTSSPSAEAGADVGAGYDGSSHRGAAADASARGAAAPPNEGRAPAGPGALDASAAHETGTTKAPGRLASGISGGQMCALKSSGEVLCWRQTVVVTGGTSLPPQSGPAEVNGVAGAVELTVGYEHVCARLRSGSVSCWGINIHGQLGDGSQAERSRPETIPNLRDVGKVQAGFEHTCALTRAGTVSCWGRNGDGQVGEPSSPSAIASPRPVAMLRDVVDLALGMRHTCALRADGTVVCWGANDRGQLGDGTSTSRATPKPVVGIEGAKELIQGPSQTCARLRDASLRCWGSNDFWQLGDTTRTDRTTPTTATIPSAASQVVVGSKHACALLDGDVQCWGSNQEFQLGVPEVRPESETPLRPRLPAKVRELAAGTSFTCALLEDGSIYTWGTQDYRSYQSTPAFVIHPDRVNRFDAQRGWTTIDQAAVSAPNFRDRTVLPLSAPRSAYRMAIDSSYLYWTAPASNEVLKAPLAGGPVTVVAAEQPIPRDIAVDGSHLYWTNEGLDGDGSVVRIQLAGGAPVILAAQQLSPRALALTRSHVYFVTGTFSAGAPTDSGQIRGVPLAGGDVVALFSARAPSALGSDGAQLFWADEGKLGQIGTITRGTLAGGVPTVLSGPALGTRSLALNATHLYWTSQGGCVLSLLKDGTPPLTATELAPGECTSHSPDAVAVDTRFVYWSHHNGRLHKAPLLGGKSTALFELFGQPGALVTNTTHLYWADGAGPSIQRLSL